MRANTATRLNGGCGGALTVYPFDAASDVWNRALACFPGATLYHHPHWLALLRRAYHLRLLVVTLEDHGELRAACVLAQSRKPFSSHFIALPFSDTCPPLGRDRDAIEDLLWTIAMDETFGRACEIRGVRAPQPWQSSNVFIGWTLNLERPIDELLRGYGRDIWRKIRRARDAGVVVESGADAAIVRRFHALQVETRTRLGLPAQPLRFFMEALESFGRSGAVEIWIASHRGRDLAANFLLRDRDCVHFKWGARRLDGPSSANHLLAHTTFENLIGRARLAELGRSDIRNQGLGTFKRECGAQPHPLPYSFLPYAPVHVGSEVLTGTRRTLSRVWRHLPLPAARILGAALYGYLT